MRDGTTELFALVNSEPLPPLAVVKYEMPETRAEILELLPALAPSALKSRVITDVEDAFGSPDELLLLTPADETAALYTLAGRREALGARTAPLVLFLLRGGRALEKLSDPDLAGLLGWLRGNIRDPHLGQSIDLEVERQRFQEEAGQTPESFLRAFRSGELPDTSDNALFYHQALGLELAVEK